MPDISFKYNCSQKWADLQDTGSEGQKFCLECKTRVHNLTEKSQAEIFEMLQQNNNQLCGYFQSDQLTNEEQKSFFHPRLVLAGIAAWLTFSAPKASAQQSNTVTTEQHDTTALNKTERNYGIVDGNPVCFIDDEPPAATAPAKWRKRRIGTTLFHIGRTRVYLSKRFPLIHVRRMAMGRF